MELPVRIHKRPRLRNPYLIIGWTDAGLVGSSAVEYLAKKLGAEQLAEIDPHDFSLLPHIVIKGGVLQEIEYVENGFYYWKNRESPSDLLMLAGRPPDIGHYELANLILDVAALFDVRRIYTVGGIYANTSHTEEPRIFAVINTPGLKEYLLDYGVETGFDYHGPTSMNGLVLGVAKHRNMDGISLWGRVPSYIGEIPNPRVCEAVLRVLTQMLAIDIDFDEIQAEARQANKQIDELVSYLRRQDPVLDRYIGKLERGMSAETSPEDRQRVFDEIERFLRKQQGRRGNDPI